ncbi:MAG: DUF4424 domain-containing protein [Hyphomicrobiaceae bacterium]|nr:DUF4424 domain-containing protein [Hyphomicrobiaceae bacterium]
MIEKKFEQHRQVFKAAPRECRGLADLYRLALAGAAMAAALTGSHSARANDSVAHIAAGGLVLARTDAIELQSEDLFVSASEIRVRYRFHNRTGADVTTLVAFPMPEVSAVSEENNFVVPEPDDATNFLGFETTVAGAPVRMQMEQKAYAVGIDRTQLLVEAGVPISPLDRDVAARLARLTPSQQAAFKQMGLIAFEDFDAGRGMERTVRPLWSVRTTYYWSQTFPANQDLYVEHRYKPSVGGAAQTMIGAEYASSDDVETYRKRYCISDRMIRDAKAMQKKRPGGGTTILSEQNLEYILTTGANWSGAIREFKLTVDGGAPENLVSFCMDGIRKVSSTRYEVTAQDFWPRRNLEILILKPIVLPE